MIITHITQIVEMQGVGALLCLPAMRMQVRILTLAVASLRPVQYMIACPSSKRSEIEARVSKFVVLNCNRHAHWWTQLIDLAFLQTSCHVAGCQAFAHAFHGQVLLCIQSLVKCCCVNKASASFLVRKVAVAQVYSKKQRPPASFAGCVAFECNF